MTKHAKIKTYKNEEIEFQIIRTRLFQIEFLSVQDFCYFRNKKKKNRYYYYYIVKEPSIQEIHFQDISQHNERD